MALGVLTSLTPVPLAGLSARSTNYSAQCYVLNETPSRDVGYVTQEKRFSIFLWNGSVADVTLTAVAGNEDAEGITWDATPPDLLIRGTSQRVNITVGVEGPLEYEALISFVSACVFGPVLTITGTRAPQLSTNVGYLFLPHNWADGLEETLAWKTNVLIAHNRTEQRIQLRTLPRRSWDLRLVVAGPARRKLETWLGMRKARQMFLPIWRDVAALSAPIAADDSLIPITDRGLKTTYYLRALGATSAEKSTINTGALNAVKSNMGAPVVTSAPVAEVAKKPEAIIEDDFAQAAPVPMACSIDNPDCEACQ